MAVDTSLRSESLSLYQYMCQHIVGTEETVRTKRLMNTIRDNLYRNKLIAAITSGSFGEGLEMKNSDIDEMGVLKVCTVHEEQQNAKLDPDKINLIMEMNDTKPGFTLLRCVTFFDPSFMEICMHMGKSWYVSSELIKTDFLKKYENTVLTKYHGPCLSDENEKWDLAVCLHNPNWIQPAKNWIHRGNRSWPSSDVRSDIIDHGVLLVPIGCKGSNNEALEWRISFSVAEKLLVYSFCHTQLICYALMKILVKDLINSNNNCKDLLCSYFIKTLIFWMFEETAVNEWKPENLIRCFMKCFKRLLYIVEYSMCPHYFIPTINMFENKIEGQSRQLLLEHLQILFHSGWRCVIFSEQFRSFQTHSSKLLSRTEIKKLQLKQLLSSKTILDNSYFCDSDSYRRCIGQLSITNSSFIKSIYLWYLSIGSLCFFQTTSDTASHLDPNKKCYCKYRKEQSYLLQNVNYDVVSGWLMLATWFYNLKQYRKALCILNNTLMKCTPELVHYKRHFSQVLMKRSRILHFLKHCMMHDVIFQLGSTLIPEELALYLAQNLYIIPPLIFAHFLCFLCHFHLDDKQYYESIQDLQRTIDENFFISSAKGKGQGYILLGMAQQLVGRNDLASKAFTNATKLDKYWNSAAKRLMMMHVQTM